jgi:hypothetical protein
MVAKSLVDNGRHAIIDQKHTRSNMSYASIKNPSPPDLQTRMGNQAMGQVTNPVLRRKRGT